MTWTSGVHSTRERICEVDKKERLFFKMSFELSVGAIEAIIKGESCVSPLLQIISSKKISAAGSSADRYRLLLSDGELTYSHAMLATQLNDMMDSGAMDNLSVIQVDKYLCNTIQGDRRVMILLDIRVVAKGEEVGGKIGNPQPYKQGESNTSRPAPAPVAENGVSSTTGAAQNRPPPNQPARPAAVSPYAKAPAGGPAANRNAPSSYSVRASAGPSTPTSNRIHSIASLTPYQNRWRIRARVTQKSNVRTWSNSRGEGKLFSVNLLDESGEIRATGFNDAVDKFYDMLEVNKVFYVSRANLKTANKQYSSVNNDYEMTFNSDTSIDPCTEETDLPTLSFDFVKINELESKQPNTVVDVIGIVKSCSDVTTVTGKQSQKEIPKRDLQLVDNNQMVVNCTLWGADAQSFDGSKTPVMAVKGARLSDWGGRSLSVLASSQVMLNPDIREAHFLRGWFDREGQSMDFNSYKSEGGAGGAGGSGTNWKTFAQVKGENMGQGDKADYFTSKGTVLFLRKENCMYMACPTESCNKKVVDQGNGQYRCEKCSREFPSFKWRMILSANIADFSDNQWVTCFQDSAETLLGISADELGSLKDSNEAAFDQVFQEAVFKSHIFKLRAKMETYNDESRLKTVCMSATPVDWCEYGRRLLDEINKMAAA